jgi:hypothetical protein
MASDPSLLLCFRGHVAPPDVLSPDPGDGKSFTPIRPPKPQASRRLFPPSQGFSPGCPPTALARRRLARFDREPRRLWEHLGGHSRDILHLWGDTAVANCSYGGTQP